METTSLITPEFDAVLVHGYWFSQREGHPVKGSLRTRLAARAGARLYDHGKGAQNIVLTEGHMWGDAYVSGAELMKGELLRLGVPGSAIIVRPNAINTDSEIETFLDEVAKNNWSKLADVAFRTHQKGIPDLFPKAVRQQTTFTSVEEILKEKDDPQIKKLVDRLSHSRYEWNFRLYELAKKVVTVLGIKEQAIEKLKHDRKTKGHSYPGDLLGLPYDVYRLK